MPKNQISDAGFWKSVLRRFHAPKKYQNQVSAQMKPDGKRKKNCAKEKFCAPCIPHTAARKWQKNSFLATRVTQWLVTRAKGCAHGSSVGLNFFLRAAAGSDWTGKKNCWCPWHACMAVRRNDRTEKKKAAAWCAGWAEASIKKLRAPSRGEVTGQNK
jgi:hypothetical protein